ncbi:MAG: L-Ala-D/L-Glu epimerase [Thermoleophilaceae bacterium]|nr:L-Ala-D/L-Glu epimerase [Thermoleophilaceae bacterium]
MSRRLLWLSIPFREPFTTSTGTVKARDLLVLRVEEPDGTVGHGEAAPFEPYDGVTIAEVARVLQERMTPVAYPQVHAADEMAFLDLEGRRLGVPIAEPRVSTVPVNFTLAGATPEDVATSAAAARADGFQCFKVKVGLPDDEARVAAARDAIGPDALLRVDANGAWHADEAIARIGRLATYGLQFVEQPCRTLEEMAVVRRECGVAIAADESVQSAADVLDAAEAGACDVVSIKLSPMGGISAARAAIDAARQSGIEPYISSTLDGPWGIAASLQLAAAEGISLHCGLATLELFDATLAAALPAPANGCLAVPPGPGLGVEVDDEAIAEVLIQEL